MAFGDEFIEGSFWVDIERLAHLNEFDEVEPAFAAFHLRNEGLGVAEPLCQHALCHPGRHVRSLVSAFCVP